MPRRKSVAEGLARELLDLYDELTALHASMSFVLTAFASALESSGTGDRRAAMGGTFCVEWLNDRSRELDDRLRKIRLQRRPAKPARPGSKTRK